MCDDSVHYNSLLKSSWLTKSHTKRFVAPLRVLSILDRHDVPSVLLGLHGLTGWMGEPRASLPVEVLVPTRHYHRAIRALAEAFPRLRRRQDLSATNFVCSGYNVRIEIKETIHRRDGAPKPESALIHVNRATSLNPLLGIAFRHAISIRGRLGTYRIPRLEFALALTFFAVLYPGNGWPDEYMAAHDFILCAISQKEIDWPRLARVAGVLGRADAKRLLCEVRDVRAGQPLTILQR